MKKYKIWKCNNCGKYQEENKRIVRKFCSEICAIESKSITKWTHIENEILYKNFCIKTKQEICDLLPNRSWYSIISHANKVLKLNRKSDRCWSEEEIKLLIKNYENLPTDELLKLIPRKTYQAIKLKARSLNLNRYYSNLRLGDIGKLLQKNCESAYWLGFLFADGHFNTNIGRVVLTLAKKDIGHLKKYANFINYNKKIIVIKNKYCSISLANKREIKKLCKLYNINSSKTYNPPMLPFQNNIDLFISFIIGFIDGDGCIKHYHNREQCCIAIKCHSSWINNLQDIGNFLYGQLNLKPPKCHINKRGYAFINMGNYRVINFIKKETIRLNLPILNRKWDKINENLEFNVVKSIDLTNKIFGAYVAIERVGSNKHNVMQWKCICRFCGKEEIYDAYNLKSKVNRNSRPKCCYINKNTNRKEVI